MVIKKKKKKVAAEWSNISPSLSQAFCVSTSGMSNSHAGEVLESFCPTISPSMVGFYYKNSIQICLSMVFLQT